MTAFEIITDLVEDPHNNGDYRLNIQGDDLRRLWDATQKEAMKQEENDHTN
jgi:hypothetical protein